MGGAQVSPTATWARKQHRLQWRLPPLAPGATGDIKAYFEPDASADLRQAAAAAAAAGDGQKMQSSAFLFGGLTAAAVEDSLIRWPRLSSFLS